VALRENVEEHREDLAGGGHGGGDQGVEVGEGEEDRGLAHRTASGKLGHLTFVRHKGGGFQ